LKASSTTTRYAVDDRARLFTGLEKGVPVVVGVVDRGEPEEARDLREAHRPDTALGITPDLGLRQLGIPERDERQGDEPRRVQPQQGTAEVFVKPPIDIGPRPGFADRRSELPADKLDLADRARTTRGPTPWYLAGRRLIQTLAGSTT
jgi:hypothetical protein